MKTALPTSRFLPVFLVFACLIGSTWTTALGEGAGEKREVIVPGTGAGAEKDAASKYKRYTEILWTHSQQGSLSYYFSKKSRMRRLLRRLYDESKLPLIKGEDGVYRQPIREMYAALQYMAGWGGSERKYLTTAKNAKQILAAFKAYNSFREGRMSEAQYKKAITKAIGFIP
ncbi:MAG: hypothetical protein KDJ16_04680 [Hyphomicrobiales bacterium]|nr:hypothetical protein [Hyphomicrobiales bacterium]